MKNDLVSIIIPVYNIEDYIEECIQSAINQTYKNLEIIVVDDGSTDNSSNIIKSFDDRRIKLFNNKNHGLGYTRNFGVKQSTGKWIFHLDGDDYIYKDCIEKLLKAVYYKTKEPREMSLCMVDNELKKNEKSINNFPQIKILNTPDKICKYLLLDQYKNNLTTFSSFGKLIRKDFIDKYDIKAPEKIQHSEDLFLTVPIWENVHNVAFVGEQLHFYRFRPESISHLGSQPEESVQGRIYLCEHIIRLFKKYNLLDKYPEVYRFGTFAVATIIVDLIRDPNVNSKKINTCLQLLFSNPIIKESCKYLSQKDSIDTYVVFCVNHNLVKLNKFMILFFNKLGLLQERPAS